jgi:3-deoxy-D-manno-octulosonate 8-phosphate phosphatase (KDO 8-P phosphatase)
MTREKLTTLIKKIKLLILDNDGVLTDGKIFFTASGEQILSFHIHDGLGIKRLQAAGVIVAVISGRDSHALRLRLTELDIENQFLGQHEKIPAYEMILSKLKLTPEEVAYVGDDLPDMPVMEKVGLPMTVANAIPDVKKVALYCTEKKGGEGAVREICDLIITTKGQ